MVLEKVHQNLYILICHRVTVHKISLIIVSRYIGGEIFPFKLIVNKDDFLESAFSRKSYFTSRYSIIILIIPISECEPMSVG